MIMKETLNDNARTICTDCAKQARSVITRCGIVGHLDARSDIAGPR
jgi:predicted nucleic acid-binding Zn ribbon protein